MQLGWTSTCGQCPVPTVLFGLPFRALLLWASQAAGSTSGEASQSVLAGSAEGCHAHLSSDLNLPRVRGMLGVTSDS